MSDNKIGIRDLKNNTSQIMRAVREEAAEYIVTHHGEPIAILRPIKPEDKEEIRKRQRLESWEKLQAIGKEINDNWEGDKTPLEILFEQRDERDKFLADIARGNRKIDDASD